MENELQSRLFAAQDLKFRDFQLRLLPGMDPDSVIGVRAPVIDRLARSLRGSEEADRLLAALPHRYFEENNLHAALLSALRDPEECVRQLNIFLPYVNNWATCDSLRPRVFARFPDRVIGDVLDWTAAEHPFTVRFGIGMLMSYYLGDAFSPEYPSRVAAIRSEEYYVNMMIAWYFATALSKRWEETIPLIESGALEPWTHNKAIQKAVESRRITPEQKTLLRSLRRRA